MSNIIHLSENVISKIAAGEVIERPAYIVKELIENAIDARAQHISISFEQYGLGKIVVSDDGTGMDKSDISICYLRHTTSKIRSDEDIINVRSMGFRGEALASIAAIGKLTVRSRDNDAAFGKEIIVEAGEIKKTSSKGMPVGTQIVVEDVFAHVPVRKHFLQSPQSEYRHSMEVIHRYAHAYPNICFEITHDGNRVLSLPVTDLRHSRTEALMTPRIFSQLYPVHHTDDYISIEGFISPPQLNYKTTRNCSWYINNRFIYESSFNAAVKRVYGTLLEPISYPYVLLFITIPPHYIDVNVHPRKEKVHMLESKKLCEVIEQSVASTLSKQNLRFFDRRWNMNGESHTDWELHDGGTKTYAADVLKKKVTGDTGGWQPIQVSDIVQMHNTYLVIPSPEGMIIVDQHAAHERVLFEKFQEAFQKEKASLEVLPLKKPIILDVSLPEKVLIREKQDVFEGVGFTIVEKDDAMLITTVPILFKDRDVQQSIRDILDDLFEQYAVSDYDTFTNVMLEYLACRSAIKAGDKLTKIQARELIDELNKTKNPYTCPHGRPTQIEMELPYLHKIFKRT